VNEDDVASLVRSAMGPPDTQIDGMAKIAELIDLTLLEFKSLAKEESGQEAQEPGAISLNLSFVSDAPPKPRGPTLESGPLGGLADELEGPDSLDEENDTSRVTGWFSRWLQR
jgi:serine/threonine-protein kinase